MLNVKRMSVYLSACMSIVFILLFSSKAFASPRPEWLQAHLNGMLHIQDSYYGAGFADYSEGKTDYEVMRLAKDRALDEMCYQLSVSVTSEFEDRIVKIGTFEKQRIASSLFISTRKVLSGVRQMERWTDDRKNRHWVMLVVDKASADQQMEQQRFVDEVVDRLENKTDELIAGNKRMASVLENNMRLIEERMNRFETLLGTIEAKVEASGAGTKEVYANLRQEILQLESSRKTYEERWAASSQRQADQMALLVAQNRELKLLVSRLAESIEGDYFLALAVDDIQYSETGKSFRVNIRPDKGQGSDYFNGEKVRFMVQASKRCYIKVMYLSTQTNTGGGARKVNTILFPNAHDRDNRIQAGETKVIGRLGELEIQKPFGRDVISVVASETQFADIDILIAGGQGAYYSEVAANPRAAVDIRTRGIQVVRPQSGTGGGAVDASVPVASVATDTCFIVSRSK